MEMFPCYGHISSSGYFSLPLVGFDVTCVVDGEEVIFLKNLCHLCHHVKSVIQTIRVESRIRRILGFLTRESTL